MEPTKHSARLGPLENVAIADLDGRPFVVGCERFAQMWTWDVLQGDPVQLPLIGSNDESTRQLALAQLDGRLVAVTGGGRPDGYHEDADDEAPEEEPAPQASGGRVRLWGLTDGTLVGKPLSGHRAGIWSIATACVGNRLLAVSGGEIRHARVWDLVRGEQTAELRGHRDGIVGVATAEWEGRAVAVTGSNDRTLRVWDVERGRQLGEPIDADGLAATAIAVTRLDGRAVALTGGHDGAIRVWDLERGEPTGAPLTGHEGRVHSIGVARLDSRPVLVSGSDDGTAQLWDLARRERMGKPLTGHDGPLAVAQVAGRPVVVSSGQDGVQVWAPRI